MDKDQMEENNMKARLYGNENRCGELKEFKIVEELPTPGEAIDSQDPDWVWGEIKDAHLDPEQRHSDDDKLDDYNFYVVTEKNSEDGTYAADHYLAIRKES